jgi:hypothetical protein
MATEGPLDEIRTQALRCATSFVSSWTGTKNAGSVVFCAKIFEAYLRTGKQTNMDAVERQSTQEAAEEA